jgi:flavin reductase (DIM6/NTAB) family NADH-FMN oxidoreductase RutF
MGERIRMEVDKRRWKISLLPGQIVFISTLNKHGVPNVAPKSWVSMVSLRMPMLGFGCNLKHQTAQNVLETKEFVLNIPDESLAKTVWKTGESPHNSVVAIQKLGLTLVPSTKVSVPRVQRALMVWTAEPNFILGREDLRHTW